MAVQGSGSADAARTFTDQWTLVTGGARGIGFACAKHLAALGSHLVLLDVDAAQLDVAKQSIVQELPQAQVRCHAVDVTDTAALEAIAAELLQAGVLVDCLITAAGIIQPIRDIDDLDRAYHDRLWEINYHGTYHCCRIWGSPMRKRGRGAVVIVASVTSFRATPLLAYGPSKAALAALAASLAVSHAPHGVRINAIAPGFTLTEGFDEKLKTGQRDAGSITSGVPMARFVTPHEVAKVTAFLLSDEASAVTGITMPVDCGWLAGAHWGTFQPMPVA